MGNGSMNRDDCRTSLPPISSLHLLATRCYHAASLSAPEPCNIAEFFRDFFGPGGPTYGPQGGV
jgi:hypothetical protein